MASDFEKIASYGSDGSGTSNLQNPAGLATDGTFIYIAEIGNHRIAKWKLHGGSYVANIGSSGTGDNNFSSPIDIIYHKGLLYVVDSGNDRIKIHRSSDLKFITSFGTNGSGNTNFDNPLGITTDGTYLYITDDDNDRLVKYTLNSLKYHSKLAFADTPKLEGICFDKHEKMLYLPDKFNSEVKKIRASNLAEVDTLSISATIFRMAGCAVKDHYLYLLNTTATGSCTLTAYDTATLTSRATTTITKALLISERMMIHRNILFWTDRGNDEYHVYYTHTPVREYNTGESLAIGGNLFNNPVVAIGGKQERQDITIGGTGVPDEIHSVEEEEPSNNYLNVEEV